VELRSGELGTHEVTQFNLVKFKTWNVKNEEYSTPRKINAILLNIKINWPKLVDMCGYKLAIYWQNFMEINLTEPKILQNVLGGYFLTHTVKPANRANLPAILGFKLFHPLWLRLCPDTNPKLISFIVSETLRFSSRIGEMLAGTCPGPCPILRGVARIFAAGEGDGEDGGCIYQPGSFSGLAY